MHEHENKSALSIEDRLEAIAYQFVTLYERWAEDRQIAAKQGADTAKLIQLFIAQVQAFKELEPHVRQQIFNSIQTAATGVAETVMDASTKAATQATETITRQLSNTVNQATTTLNTYQREVLANQWKVIGATIITTVITCLLLVWLFIPKPTLPLTPDQLQNLSRGEEMDLIWPKLTKKEQGHWLKLESDLEASIQNTSNNTQTNTNQ